MPKILITRPAFEQVTSYLFAWNENVVATAKKNFIVFDLKNKDATRANLEKNIKNENPELVILNGHGNYDAITGDKEEVLIQVDDNEEILKNRVVYAMSCETAKNLGPSCVEHGAKAYIGYDEVFVFYTTKGVEKTPLKDKRAAYFLNPAMEINYCLLQGQNAGDAHKTSVNAFKYNIQKLSSSSSKESYLVRYLLWDVNHQKCLGDKNAKV